MILVRELDSQIIVVGVLDLVHVGRPSGSGERRNFQGAPQGIVGPLDGTDRAVDSGGERGHLFPFQGPIGVVLIVDDHAALICLAFELAIEEVLFLDLVRTGTGGVARVGVDLVGHQGRVIGVLVQILGRLVVVCGGEPIPGAVQGHQLGDLSGRIVDRLDDLVLIAIGPAPELASVLALKSA